jgi:lauroyl/myristoyl acyltransferase
MQDRMQGDSKVLGLVYRVVFGTLFPLFEFAARTYTRRERGLEICDQVMEAFVALRPKYLEAVKGNMAQVTGLGVDHPEVERLARQMVKQHTYAWLDFVWFGQRPPEAALANVASLVGAEHLDAALAGGRGAILLTAHAGNYELGGLLLRSKRIAVHAVYKPDRFQAVEDLRARMRSSAGVVGIPVSEGGFSTLPLVKVLREGKVVGMQGDRDFSLNGLPIPFCGREAYFPRGPWELAAMTGAPILPTFFFLDADHRFHAHFGAPIHITGERGARMAAMEAGMRAYVADLEALVKRDPSQWYCFYPFWDDPARRPTTL